jgi:hypothetical protein
VAFGDDSDLAVDDSDGGLVVDGVAQHVERGGPALRLGEAELRDVRVVEVREDPEVDQPQRSTLPVGDRQSLRTWPR